MSNAPMTQQQGGPWSMLAQHLAKKRGIDEQEAALWLQAVQSKEGLTFMDQVAQNAPVLRSLDPGVQRDALSMMAYGAAQPKDDIKELKSLAMQMTVLREAMRGDQGQKPGTDPQIQEEMKQLRQTIESLKAEEQTRKFEALQQTFADKLEKMEVNLKAEIAAATPGVPTEEKDSLLKAVEQLKAYSVAKDEFKLAFGVKDEATPERSIEKALEEAKKLGYRIQGPKTLDDIQKEITEQVKKAREDAVKETTAKLQSDDKKMGMLISLGQAALDGILPAVMAGTTGEGGAAEGIALAKKALSAASAGT